MSIALIAIPLWAQDGSVHFRKLRLNPQFYSEGITAGDFDKDGKTDIAAGPYFYPGPDLARKVTFRQARSAPFDSAGDSDCYSLFPFDFNGDGWMDLLSTRLDGGAEAVWYENPKGATGYWPERAVFSTVQNESATLLDIDKDGKPELITNSGGYCGWVAPDWTRPASPWAFHAVTEKGTWGAFTHGIGAGDLNGDGRLDLIFPTGWWEQPAAAATLPWKTHPAAFWGQAAPGEGPGGAQIHAYDVDGDGDSDVVTSLQAHGFGLSWFENQGGGESFSAHPLLGLPSDQGKYGAAFSQLHALAVADLDGDGLRDLITGKRKGAHGNGVSDVDSPAVLYWFRLTRPAGQPAHFTPYLIDSEAGVGTQITIADVNADGAPDILVARRRGAFVFFNERDGTGIRFRGGSPGAKRGARSILPRLLFPEGEGDEAGKDALGRDPRLEP
ncbi:MAG: VCBS repeat-containing protein [Fibrobacteria bacterium]